MFRTTVDACPDGFGAGHVFLTATAGTSEKKSNIHYVCMTNRKHRAGKDPTTVFCAVPAGVETPRHLPPIPEAIALPSGTIELLCVHIPLASSQRSSYACAKDFASGFALICRPPQSTSERCCTGRCPGRPEIVLWRLFWMAINIGPRRRCPLPVYFIHDVPSENARRRRPPIAGQPRYVYRYKVAHGAEQKTNLTHSRAETNAPSPPLHNAIP